MPGAKVDAVAVAAVILLAAVFVGEYFTYCSDAFSYDADVTFDDGGISYHVESSTASPYDVVVLDNGGFSVEELRVYVDPTYSRYYGQASSLSNVAYVDQSEFPGQVAAFLAMRSFQDVSSCGESELEEYLSSTLGDARGKALVVASYALPAAVYDGTPDCLLLRWIGAGGAVYWFGAELGRFYTDSDGLHTVEGNQELFLGAGAVNPDDELYATNVVDNGFTDALRLRGSNLLNAVCVEGVPGALAMGYCEDGYSSVSFVPLGEGFVCVLSGVYDIDPLDDLAQIVAAGVNPASAILAAETGEVKGSADGSIAVDAAGATVFVAVGGTYLRYGEAFLARGGGVREAHRLRVPRPAERHHRDLHRRGAAQGRPVGGVGGLRLRLLGDGNPQHRGGGRPLRRRGLLLHAGVGVRAQPGRRAAGRPAADRRGQRHRRGGAVHAGRRRFLLGDGPVARVPVLAEDSAVHLRHGVRVGGLPHGQGAHGERPQDGSGLRVGVPVAGPADVLRRDSHAGHHRRDVRDPHRVPAEEGLSAPGRDDLRHGGTHEVLPGVPDIRARRVHLRDEPRGQGRRVQEAGSGGRRCRGDGRGGVPAADDGRDALPGVPVHIRPHGLGRRQQPAGHHRGRHEDNLLRRSPADIGLRGRAPLPERRRPVRRFDEDVPADRDPGPGLSADDAVHRDRGAVPGLLGRGVGSEVHPLLEDPGGGRRDLHFGVPAGHAPAAVRLGGPRGHRRSDGRLRVLVRPGVPRVLVEEHRVRRGRRPAEPRRAVDPVDDVRGRPAREVAREEEQEGGRA